MKRREVIALLGGAIAAWPLPLSAQQPRTGKTRRIGYLGTGGAYAPLLEAFRLGLRELGWVEGQTIVIEYRFAEGQLDRLAGLAEELVRLEPHVIVASPTPAALAAKSATGTIPIVGIGVDNPVEHGLIASLARPGGNVTGVAYSVGPEIFGKDLELLREVVPNTRRVAVLSNSTGANHALMISHVNAAARSLGVDVVLLDARGPEAFDDAFVAMVKERAGAVFVFGDPMFSFHRARIAELAARHRLPSMHTNRLFVEAGGLMCYGPSFPDLWRRAASYVDRLLRGGRPADLPVEQPTRFELVINLKTAKALGLTIPESVLVRADEVIE